MAFSPIGSPNPTLATSSGSDTGATDSDFRNLFDNAVNVGGSGGLRQVPESTESASQFTMIALVVGGLAIFAFTLNAARKR